MISFPATPVLKETLAGYHYMATPDFRSFLGWRHRADPDYRACLGDRSVRHRLPEAGTGTCPGGSDGYRVQPECLCQPGRALDVSLPAIVPADVPVLPDAERGRRRTESPS